MCHMMQVAVGEILTPPSGTRSTPCDLWFHIFWSSRSLWMRKRRRSGSQRRQACFAAAAKAWELATVVADSTIPPAVERRPCLHFDRDRRQPGTKGPLMDSVRSGTLRHFWEHVGGVLQGRSGDHLELPLLLEPVAGGPRWRYENVGLGGEAAESSRSVVIRGRGMAQPVISGGYPTIDACIEQVRRSLAVGDRCAAAEWAQRLTDVLTAEAGDDPLWSPRHG